MVRKVCKLDSLDLKLMAIYLYPLPLSLKSYEPVDSCDIQYLNQSYFPIINQLNKPLKIELYNEIWFDKVPQTFQFLFDYNHPTLAFPEPQLTPFTSLFDLHAEKKTISPSPLIENSDTDILSPLFPNSFIKIIVCI